MYRLLRDHVGRTLVTLQTDELCTHVNLYGSHDLDADKRIMCSFNLVDMWSTYLCYLNTAVSCSYVTSQTVGSHAVGADMGNMLFLLTYEAYSPVTSRQMFHDLV
jgi:hypothetical protein